MSNDLLGLGGLDLMKWLFFRGKKGKCPSCFFPVVEKDVCCPNCCLRLDWVGF